MSRPGASRADLASLGVGAPVRALYEVSKHLGGHRVVLRALARRTATEPVPPLRPLPPPPPVPPVAAARTRRAADEILAGRVVLFGRPVEVGHPPDWHGVLHAPGRWPVDDWWRIDIRSPRRRGDVKWAWELSRHQHLVVLARTVHLDPDDPSTRRVLEQQLWSWISSAPPELGVPWASNLEIALRSLAWIEILSLAGDLLDRALVQAMTRVLWHAGSHLVAELPYTLSTMPNNHLVADAVGLAALGLTFDHPRARRWHAIGSRLLARQCRREIRPDGSSIEGSLSYHRFVVELLVRHLLLTPGAGGHATRATAPVRAALARATAFLTGLGVLASPVPQFGDWDAARALVSTGDPADLRGTVAAALAVLGRGAPSGERAELDEVAWYVPEGIPRPAVQPSATSTAGGVIRVVRGPFTVVVRSGPPGWHGHADLTATAVAVDGHWVIGDPGTGTYNGAPAVRNHFRGSAPHGVLLLDGHELLRPHRVFRWLDRAGGGVRPAIRVGEGLVVVAWHDAYRRLDPPRGLVRTVYVDASRVVLADWVEDPPAAGPVSWSLQLTSAPELSWRAAPGGWVAQLPSGRSVLAAPPGSVQVRRGGTGPVAGWWSPTYGQVVPTEAFVCRGGTAGPVVTEVTLAGRSCHRVEDGRLHLDTAAAVGDLWIGVRWSGGWAGIAIGHGDATGGRWERTGWVPVRT